MTEPRLLNTLLGSSSAVLRRDDKPLSARGISASAVALADELQPFQGRRIGVLSPYADHIAVALAAGELANCSVVLYRANELPRDLVERWHVSAIIDSSLGVMAAGEYSPESALPYLYIPTSGTTGEPKLVQHTMHSLLGRIGHRHDTFHERARWLLTYHPATFGGLQVLLTALHDGADLVAVSKPSIPALRDAALEHQVTHISATPTFWRGFLLALGDRASDLKVKQITLGGEIADEAVLQVLREKFPSVPIRHIYASTEAGALFSVRDGHPGFPAEWLTTGVDGVQLRIIDGILQVRSPRAMVGYAAPATSVTTNDGWLITGDQVDHVGHRVYFRGRQDSVLNVGGAKVKPEEIEEAILRIKEVADVHVYGVPNPLTGIVVAADIVPGPGKDAGDLRQLITARLRSVLEPYKIPRLIKFVESIPLSAAGKKQKKQKIQ